MAATKYTYSVSGDFPNQAVHVGALLREIGESSITIAVDEINRFGDIIDIWMKAALTGAEETTLDGVVAAHQGTPDDIDPPVMDDGRPIVRADTRPIDFETYFTMAGDSTGIGTGQILKWDFSNSDNDYEGPDVPNGFKCKQMDLTFICPLYPKDGAVYFFDAPWGCYFSLDIVVPAGNYYPNSAGTIPAATLGLSGSLMYAYASEDVVYQRYVNKHHLFGTNAYGDELNAEGCSVNPIPIGWILRGSVYTPESDTTSKGFGSFETYRCHTILKPGQTPDNIH
jgi:hypothetical protein